MLMIAFWGLKIHASLLLWREIGRVRDVVVHSAWRMVRKGMVFCENWRSMRMRVMIWT